jgi:predicted Zn-dependent protease
MLGTSRIFAGRAAQAIEPLRRGFRLNPNDPQAFNWMNFMALAHILIGEPVEAAERAAETIAMRPDSHLGYAMLACSLGNLGREAEAGRALQDMRRLLPRPGALDHFMTSFVDPTDRARFLDGMRRAGWTEPG